jgi:hypothetical protein
MTTPEVPAPTADDLQFGQFDDIPDAPLVFPNPDASPGEFMVFLRSLSDRDLASAWEHLNRRPGRSPNSNLYDEECVQDWTDKMDTYIVSSSPPSKFIFNTVTNGDIGSSEPYWPQLASLWSCL